MDQWLERFEPCLSRTELQQAILVHSDISASRVDKLVTAAIHQQRDSGGVPFWARGTLELAPQVLEACPVLHINMHVLQDILQLYLRALKVNYFPGGFNPLELDTFTSKVKALIKNEIKSTKSSPRAGFLAEYQLRQIVAHHVAVFNTSDPLFAAQMYFANWYQQEVYTPHSAYTNDHTPEEGTRRYRRNPTIHTKCPLALLTISFPFRLYVLTLVMWAIQGGLEERVLVKEMLKPCRQRAGQSVKKPKALKIESLPWHTFVEHLPALHHQLGSLAELLSLEHEGEHGHRPLALYADTRCSHQGNVLNQMRGTSMLPN
mgnify:CR=1 FL=1